VAAWHPATVVAVTVEARRAKTFRLRVPGGIGHRAGQHEVVRLTAPDGYTAQRSYSIASAPDGSDVFDLTVERLDGGEVSDYLHDVVVPGDVLEIQGPIGGWFVWDATSPALLIGGGSGVVPLMAMIRLARHEHAEGLVRALVSVRSPQDLYYPDELTGPQVTIVYTRQVPPGHTRPPGRVQAEDLLALISPARTVYVCGSDPFADAMTSMLEGVGVEPSSVRVERFGAT
jgi:ferredoxin-NADP reductase